MKGLTAHRKQRGLAIQRGTAKMTSRHSEISCSMNCSMFDVGCHRMKRYCSRATFHQFVGRFGGFSITSRRCLQLLLHQYNGIPYSQFGAHWHLLMIFAYPICWIIPRWRKLADNSCDHIINLQWIYFYPHFNLLVIFVATWCTERRKKSTHILY